MTSNNKNSLFDRVYDCLMLTLPASKVSCAHKIYAQWSKDELVLDSVVSPVHIDVPGRPDKPELVHPRKVPKRGFNSESARIRLVHAIAHIEFNAINLALDAVYRFRGMPKKYYSDWLHVADEEALHFTLLNDYLISKGSSYGDYAAHNGLWEMAVKSDHDVLVRMALVPRVLEARGLDVTPGMINKLQAAGDTALVDILEVIYRDEIGHVQIGSHWFNELCKQRSVSPHATFDRLLDEYMEDAVFGPFDKATRSQAGFSSQEIKDLMRRNEHLHNG
jgi:uncharacterized ferritin-like protein (DUF455 family)